MSFCFSLPRPGRCKFCRARILSGTAIQGAMRMLASEMDESNIVQFPCPICEMKMLAVTHASRFVEYKGALEEEEEQEQEKEPPCREQQRTPNVAGNDNRLREALKRSRMTRQALQNKPTGTTPPPSQLQLAYKKQ